MAGFINVSNVVTRYVIFFVLFKQYYYIKLSPQNLYNRMVSLNNLSYYYLLHMNYLLQFCVKIFVYNSEIKSIKEHVF